MRQNSDSFEDILKNPLYIAMGSVIFFLAVVLFCVIVWKVTHVEGETVINPDKVVQTEDTIEKQPEATPPVAVETPEPTATPDPVEEALAKLIAEQSNDQGVVFTEIRDTVTAVGVTNLRSEPSTAKQRETVVAVLENGENVLRVGYNEEIGWSKLIYNDTVVYASTEYIVIIEDSQE